MVVLLIEVKIADYGLNLIVGLVGFLNCYGL